MKTLLRFHRWLSLFIAPAMIFFAVSGALQSYRLQEDRKDGSYKASAPLKVMGEVHKADRLSPRLKPLFQASQTLLSAVFVLTAAVGIAIAFRIARPSWPVWLALATGTLLPVLVAVATRP